MRATQVGAFQVLPAEASLMYDATQWGRSASSLLVVDTRPAPPPPDVPVVWQPRPGME
jgi:hypothetical protein